MAATLVLGRDGMGAEATEEDFDAWVAYVCANIDAVCGFDVTVETVPPKAGGQWDDIRGGDQGEREDIQRAKEQLWERWCAEGGPPQDQAV